MLAFTRMKRVTDPFDHQARARLVGTDHRQITSAAQGDSDSLSLSCLIHGFLEQDTTNDDSDSVIHDSDWDPVDSVDDSPDSPSNSPSLSFLHSNNADPYRNLLIAHVSEALESLAFLRERNASLFRRSVAAFLRERRHDAAVCETARDSSGGSHEFIDVVQTGSATCRYFVDLDFRAQFEIARPTRRFSEALAAVPGVFVGGAEELKRTVSTACDAARRCFRSRGLPVPPWRKNRFMQNKWFGPCRRTARDTSMGFNGGVSCRVVGFDDVVSEAGRGGGVVVRTR
ncbi:hypothetical protein GLYMA_08G346100v4 [Glycine max]|uniref:Uncharacterized protein n=3 Tax=Glycine subgen. Soja TaxID=1462606 RepID=I1KZ12_SOYBN|nr:hypothetical protein JHK85_023921 [Glycine max]KAH1054517.1 hypothetical protein GYH30_023346 [Glycine max]KRH46613.1 hypothetical protein GLYMA_08G346100v4 [Glycine max]RZC00219.1 hypothetical protein D0Y65_022539 [Glycine soja]